MAITHADVGQRRLLSQHIAGDGLDKPRDVVRWMAAALAPEHASRVVPGGNGTFQPCIVAGGQVVGTWKRTLRKNGVAITLSPFAPGAVSTDHVRDAARRLGDFLGLPLSSIETTDG